VVNDLVAVGVAVISVAGALVSAFYGRRLARQEKLEDADRLAVRFREPLLQAAFNLQSRLYNIVRLDFLHNFMAAEDATPDEREYAVQNTVYLIGQYLGWLEVIRRESQFIDPRSRARNREIAECVEHVRQTFSDSRTLTDPTFRLFRGEQRAIGEVMLSAATVAVPDAPRWECIGYAQFVANLDSEGMQRWFRRLQDDVALLAKDLEAHLERVVHLQRALVDLVDVLDPDSERVPSRLRQRL
jgi:hypothetical protein